MQVILFIGEKKVCIKMLALVQEKTNYPVWLAVCCRKRKLSQTRILANSQRQSYSSQLEDS